jgi:hypothetical protein
MHLEKFEDPLFQAESVIKSVMLQDVFVPNLYLMGTDEHSVGVDSG